MTSLRQSTILIKGESWWHSLL